MYPPAPNVGRIVHYTTTDDDETTCLAAIITHTPDVHTPEDTPVGLAVFGINGTDYCQSVPLADDDHTDGTWHWPESTTLNK